MSFQVLEDAEVNEEQTVGSSGGSGSLLLVWIQTGDGSFVSVKERRKS